MRKLISLMHVSLDGFCAGPGGEMNWIGLNEAIFADVHGMIDTMGGAVYGRTTYAMMRGYWPGVLHQEDADPGQRAHARWVEAIPKFTFSRTLTDSDWNNVRLYRDAAQIEALKKEDGAPLLIFGSPSLVHSFLHLDVIDEYWIYLNPVLLGRGIRYLDGGAKSALKLVHAKPFDNGVTRLHYAKTIPEGQTP